MAKGFNLTAQINLKGPNNLKPIVADIKRELGTIQANVSVKLDSKSAKSVNDITRRLSAMNSVLVQSKQHANDLKNTFRDLSAALGSFQSTNQSTSRTVQQVGKNFQATAKNIQVARTEMEEFGRQTFLAVKRFAAFSLPTTGIFAFVNAINSGIKAFIDFDKELIKLQQVTGKGSAGISGLEQEITRLATSLGVSSESLLTVASTLAQAGLSAEETRIALAALAKTELAPSFDDLKSTTEGAIAALRQFSLGAGDLEAALGSINAVAAAFAVESADIITAIQRTGGVFAAASKGVTQGKDALNEFIAVFTSVRATTRESAETIATGLRTIFTRIQRAGTIKQLKEFGVNLQDLEGKFVGPFEAVKRLSEALNQLDPRDVRFSTIVEELGGFRQIGKVIPLIQQFATAQQALGVAQKGAGSLAEAQKKAQESLANQIAKVREQFLALVRDIGKSTVFKGLFTIITGLTSGLIGLAGAFKPILPLLGIFAAVKGVKAIAEIGSGFFGGMKKGGGARAVGSNIGETLSGAKEKEASDVKNRATVAISENTNALKTLTTAVNSLTSAMNSRGPSKLKDGGKILGFNNGGMVPGNGGGDTVPAFLEGGEIVMNRKAVKKYGAGNLLRMNSNKTKGFAIGGATWNDAVGTDFKIDKKSGARITDGDTIAAKVFTVKEYRLDAVDAAETNPLQKYGKEATSVLARYQDNLLDTITSGKGGAYGRGKFRQDQAASEIVERGYGIPDFRYGGQRFQNQLDFARKKGKGIWNSSNYNHPKRILFEADNKQDIAKEIALGRGIQPQTRFSSGGPIQKFMAGSPGGINVPSGKGRGKKVKKGARGKFEHLNQSQIESLSTEEMIDYAKRQMYHIMTTGGSGISLGEEFVEVPRSRIDPELEKDLITLPDGRRGFYREKIAPFGSEQVAKSKKSEQQQRREKFFRTSRNLLEAAMQGIMAPGSALPKAQQDAISPFLEMVTGDYGLGLSATPRLKSEEAPVVSAASTLLASIKDPLSEFRKSGGQTSLAGVIPASAAEKIKAAIPAYIESLKKENETQKVGKAQTTLKYFDDFINGGTAAKPAHATHFAETVNQILKGGLVQGFAEGGSPTPQQLVGGPFPKGRISSQGETWSQILTKRAGELGLAIDSGSLVIGGRTISLSKALTPAQLRAGTIVGKAVGNNETTIKALASLRENIVKEYLSGRQEVDEADPFNLTEEEKRLARSIAVVGIASDYKTASRQVYKKVGGVPFSVSIGSLSGAKSEEVLAKLRTKDFVNLQEAASELLPDRPLVNLTDQDLNRLGRPNAEGYQLEAILALLGATGGEYNERNRAVDFEGGLPPDLAALFGVPSGVFTQAKRTLNSDNVGHAIEGIAARLSGVRMAFGGQVNGPGFEEIKQQIIDKYPEIQFRISKRKRAWGYNLMGALKSEGGLSSGNNRFNFEQPGNLKQLQEYADKLASELMSPEQLAMGGLISNFASGGTIPAMVSNGEAFIPPSQAKKIGYAKLNKMNQADRNGMSGFAVGGGVFKGPGSGTSDSIGPVDLPVGGYVIRKKAVDALTSKFNSGGYVGDAKTFAAGGSVIPKNIARKAEIEKETVRLKGLEEKRGSVSGIEKNILENEISRTADKIKQLEAEIEGAIQGFDDATNRVTETNQALYNANQTLVDSVKAKYEAVNKGKKWEDLSLKQQDKLVKESRTGRYRGMFAAENKAIDVAEQRADKARRRKEKGYDGVTSAEQVREAGLTPQEIANREQADQAMIAYRAKQAGVSEKGYKYQLAQQLGKKAYEAKDLYAGRVEEMKTGLITKQETLQNIRQQKNQAQNIIKKGSAAGATEADKAAAAAASTQLADANTRLAMETENIFQQMRQVNPTLPLKDVQDAAAKVAEQLSQGDIKGAQEEMVKAMGKIPEDAEAMQIAMQQLARELNIDVKQLERTFQGGAESKLLQRQQFAQSREGQRFGALSEFAPDTAKLLSKIPGLGSAADFISGKGGKYSKAFANMGGIQGLGAGVAVGAEALKNFMPEGSLRDPNTAGIFGAVSGAGAMGAGGAQLGMMVAGPVGALIGGIGGAIIGGIQGFWDAQNATILQNSLDALAESSGNVDKAFQVLDAQFNKANFKEVEIAIGKQIESQASVEKIAMAGPSFLGPNAEQRKEAAAASSAAAISTTKNLTRLVESNLSKTSLADLQKTRINLEAGRGENPILAQAKSIAKMQGLNEAEAARTASINAAVAQLKESGVQEEQITKLKRESSDELAKTGEKLLNTQALLIARQQELNRIMHEVAKVTESMMDALASLQGRIQRFGDGINDILTESENIANPNEIRRVKRTSGERILSNTAGYSRDEIQGAIDSIVQRMGGGTEAISLGKQVSAGEDLRKVLPALLRQSGASTDTTKITDAATSILQRSGLDRNDPLITSIISELGKKLEGAKGEGGQGLGLLADEIEKVGLGGFSKVLDSAKESLIDFDRKTNDAFDALTKVQNQWVDAMMRSIDYSNRATQVELQGALELQKALGQSVSLEEMNKPFETEVKGLTGGTLDPVAINRGIIESREKLRQLENERASLAIQPESERREKALAANDESTRKYKLSIDKADKALKMLAENGSTAANALQKLSENQGRAKAFSNTLSDIVFDSQKRMDLAPKLAAFVTGQKALQQGDNRLFGNEIFGKQYLGGIDLLGQLGVKDEKLTQLRNQATIEGLKAQGQGALLQQVIPGAEKLFGQGNDTIEEILNFASNPENDPLVQAVKDAYEAQKAALDALSASAADIANNLKSSGIDPIIKELSTALPNLIKKAYDEAKANLAAATKEAAAAAATTPTAETPSAPRQSLVQRYAGNYTTQPTPREQRAIERGRASGYKSGGLIYASAGQYVNFEPRGTDTVAAMLTPGEFVVNAKATAENLDLLQAMNSGKSINPSYMSNGGFIGMSQIGEGFHRLWVLDLGGELDSEDPKAKEYAEQMINTAFDRILEGLIDVKNQAKISPNKEDDELVNDFESSLGDLTNTPAEVLSQLSDADFSSWRNPYNDSWNKFRDSLAIGASTGEGGAAERRYLLDRQEESKQAALEAELKQATAQYEAAKSRLPYTSSGEIDYDSTPERDFIEYRNASRVLEFIKNKLKPEENTTDEATKPSPTTTPPVPVDPSLAGGPWKEKSDQPAAVAVPAAVAAPVSNYQRAQKAKADYKAAQQAKLQAYNQEMQRRREAAPGYAARAAREEASKISPEARREQNSRLSDLNKRWAAGVGGMSVITDADGKEYSTRSEKEQARKEAEARIAEGRTLAGSDGVGWRIDTNGKETLENPQRLNQLTTAEREALSAYQEQARAENLKTALEERERRREETRVAQEKAGSRQSQYGQVPTTVDRAAADLAKTRALRESIELREEMDRLAQEKNYNNAADMAGKQAAERSKVAASQQQKEQDRIKADQRLGIARGELNNLTQRLGREPTDQEIMDEFRIPEEQVKSFRDSVANVEENPGRARVRRLQALFAERLLSDPKYIKYQNLQSQGFQSFVNSKIEQLYGASLEDPGSDKTKYPYKDEADIDGLFPRVELDFYNRQDKFKDMERESKSKITKQVWDEYRAGKFDLEQGAGFAPDSMAAKAAKFAGGAGRYAQDLTRGTVGAGINVAAGTIGMGLSGLGLLVNDVLKGAGRISEEQSNFNRELLFGFGNRSQQLFGVAGSDAFRLAEQTGRGLAGESLLRTESAGEAFDRKNIEDAGDLGGAVRVIQFGRDVVIDAMTPTPGPKGPKTVASNLVDTGLDMGRRVDQADNARTAALRARDAADAADLANREAAAKLRKATPQPLAADSPQARFINEKEAVKQIAAKQPVDSARKQAATAQTQTQSSIPKGSGRPTTRFELTEDIPKFRIQGVDVNGKEIVKVIQAASEDAALRASKQEGIYSVTGLAKHKDNPKIPTRLNRGGIVYASNGTLVPYQPRGSDTVPAMLTPGEFVVNSDATSNNLPLLQHLNKGGMVRYYQQGSTGPVPSSGSASSNNSSSSTAYKVDSSGLDSFLTNFGSYVDKLTKITFPTIPDTITMNGNHVVDVRVSGAAAFEAINENVKNMINTAIDEKMGELWRQSNGQLGSRPVSATAGGSKSTGAIMQ